MLGNVGDLFGGQGRMLALIELIYASVQQPDLWPTVMDEIAEAVQGQSTTMFAQLPGGALVSIARTDPQALSEYVGHYASVNEMSRKCDELFPDGTVRYGNRALPDAQLMKTEFYNDFFKRHDWHYSLGMNIPMGSLPAAYLSCQRSKSSGTFTEKEGMLYEALLPHLQRALQLHLQMTQMQSAVLGLETALDRLGHAVFGLDAEGNVMVANRAAESIVRSGDALRLSNRRLSAVLFGENLRLQACIVKAVECGIGPTGRTGNSLLLERKSEKPPLRVTAMHLSSSIAGSSTQMKALVFVSDSSAVLPSRAATLRTLFALTPTETRVAELMLQAMETRDISQHLSLTLETTRFHIKCILSKTGTRRQTELMRLMLSLPQS